MSAFSSLCVCWEAGMLEGVLQLFGGISAKPYWKQMRRRREKEGTWGGELVT